MQNSIPAWTYRFVHTLTCPWLTTLPEEALQVVGGNTYCGAAVCLCNLNKPPLPDGTCSLSQDEQGISKDLIEAWTAMAVSGNPSAEGLEWLAYSLGLNVLILQLPE